MKSLISKLQNNSSYVFLIAFVFVGSGCLKGNIEQPGTKDFVDSMTALPFGSGGIIPGFECDGTSEVSGFLCLQDGDSCRWCKEGTPTCKNNPPCQEESLNQPDPSTECGNEECEQPDEDCESCPADCGECDEPEDEDNSCFPFPASDLDVTIPDNSLLTPGEQFDKTWKLRNCGTSTWNEADGFSFERVRCPNGKDSGDPVMSDRDIISVPSTQPGQSVELTVSMAAPNANGEEYVNCWQMHRDGKAFGIVVWVDIDVDNSCDPQGASESDCGDEQDNDCDGFIDCEDPDCTGDVDCPNDGATCVTDADCSSRVCYPCSFKACAGFKYCIPSEYEDEPQSWCREFCMY